MDLFLRNLKEYWFIIVFIFMVIVSWNTFSSRLSATEARLDKVENIINSFETIKIDIAVIKNDVQSIKSEVKK